MKFYSQALDVLGASFRHDLILKSEYGDVLKFSFLSFSGVTFPNISNTSKIALISKELGKGEQYQGLDEFSGGANYFYRLTSNNFITSLNIIYQNHLWMK